MAVAVAAVPIASQTASDPDSAALTEYLHNHRLPAVGAQITAGEDGSRTVMLYGFVATQKGFDDAAERTRNFLHDPYVRITNRVKIEPELLALHKRKSQATSGGDGSQQSSGAGSALADNTPPPADVGDIQQYEAQNQTADPYGIPGQSSLATGSSLLIPLIGGLIIYGAMSGLGSSGYASPPSYPYFPPGPTYPYSPTYPYPPSYTPHRHYHGNPFHSGFSSPPPASFTPHFATLAPPPPHYVPPPRFSSPSPIQHPYFGGGFGGGFSGGFRGGHR